MFIFAEKTRSLSQNHVLSDLRPICCVSPLVDAHHTAILFNWTHILQGTTVLSVVRCWKVFTALLSVPNAFVTKVNDEYFKLVLILTLLLYIFSLP